jgi:ABC-type amino acid transport system permease subunit
MAVALVPIITEHRMFLLQTVAAVVVAMVTASLPQEEQQHTDHRVPPEVLVVKLVVATPMETAQGVAEAVAPQQEAEMPHYQYQETEAQV